MLKKTRVALLALLLAALPLLPFPLGMMEEGLPDAGGAPFPARAGGEDEEESPSRQAKGMLSVQETLAYVADHQRLVLDIHIEALPSASGGQGKLRRIRLRPVTEGVLLDDIRYSYRLWEGGDGATLQIQMVALLGKDRYTLSDTVTLLTSGDAMEASFENADIEKN